MEKLLLIDGHSILNRAFYGVPDLTNQKGIHTNAVYGFLNIMLKLIDEEEPDYITVAFDVHAPTFRHKMYAAYKGTRKPMAEELRQQVPMIKEMLFAMGIVTVEKEGLEADDILGTLSKRAIKDSIAVTVVSGDRDLLQLADENIKISIPTTRRGTTTVTHYFARDVLEQKGVTPEEFIDVKALWGDTADNIPGVPGIGEKTATAIIQKYHSIEAAHEHAAELKPPRAAKNIAEYYDQAVLSKKLATIDTDCELDYDINAAKYKNPFTPEAHELCREWEFRQLLSRFSDTPDIAPQAMPDFLRTDDIEKAGKVYQKADKDTLIGVDAYFDEEGIRGVAVSDGSRAVLYDGNCGYELIEGIYDSNHRIAFFDVKNTIKNARLHGQYSLEEKLLSSKDDRRVIDISVAAYLLNPLAKTYTADGIAGEYLKCVFLSYEELFARTKYKKAWYEKPDEMVTYLCSRAYVAAKGFDVLCKALEEKGMRDLYFGIELPLVFTLAATEREGIGIDREALKAYGMELEVGIEELQEKIYKAAGEEFNINSPKQLGEVLFERLKLPGGKKTKTGYSTAAGVLEKLSGDYDIVDDILKYRQLAKLKSTYADGLADCIDDDGRIRTTFEQTVTATGRLSSTAPNLQNIPIRLELGKAIRKVFHPKEGYVFVDSDYSQIELRVLADMSKDENLIEAYRRNQDIHRTTASLVFDVPFEEVTELQRRGAKAVNFGIVYGISAFGLGEDLGISRKEAQDYINDYYKAYPMLKEFLDGCISFARDKGYSVTLFGRRRPIPELSSSNFMQRSFGERVAMNSPIQGTAADIIKIAMNRVYDRLKKDGLESRLILQVHDELLIEAKESEKDEARRILEEEMRAAADLAVTLEVDVHEGSNWYDAK